ncbi:hypothetical protein [Pinibacter aurantiacus]|uniref:Uncharacterized protein n=1 Tax=Pinibacter aurantiacus TaxID=2851599 RepID=A0A9E2W4S1_9BACT|nr:hypothetical protein [Pinibacter aurantiacus]MBV4357813.1 hypothetical protein [Pinibacter aurantiacus]
MTTHLIKMFLKFGQEKHIRDLYQNGTIFMNSIEYFRKLEDDGLRGDSYEGIKRIKNYPAGQFEIQSLNFKGNYLSLQVREAYETVVGNIFSLYCISSHGWANPNDFKIDEKIKKFGSHCLLIKDNPQFLFLIEEKLKELKVKFNHNFVNYYDKDKVDREITLFEKPLEFEYQKEFRLYVEQKLAQPFIFKIGNLADVAEIYNSKDIVDSLRLTNS